MVDRRWRRAELIQAGFAAEFVNRVAEMVRRNHYKRRMPVIAKLSQRTWTAISATPGIGGRRRLGGTGVSPVFRSPLPPGEG